MIMDTRTNDSDSDPHRSIFQYDLDFEYKAGQNCYVWRISPDKTASTALVLVVNLHNTFLPNDEIEKMISFIIEPDTNIRAIVFVNYNARNKRKIKQKLKAQNVQLFSKTVFFSNLDQAKQWIVLHQTSR